MINKWNMLKQQIQQKKNILTMKKREIYFLSIGCNIGQESYGKKELYLRPVLVYKKLSKTLFVGIPLTSQQKEGSYYFSFSYKKEKISVAMFNQIRVFDIRRADYRSGVIKLSDYKRLAVKLNEFMNFTPLKREMEHSSLMKLQKSNQSITNKSDIVNSQNIFVTGSNGFIGSHLKEYLKLNYLNYALFTPSSKELDLINEKDVEHYILSNNIDIIIHLANRGGGRDTIDMKNVTEYNLKVFFNIAKHEKNVKKIISFGSGAEYGKHKPIIEVKEEDYLLKQPFDEYGFYKSITSKYIEKSDKIVQLRIFGAYGEYEDYRYKFISNAIVKNILKLPIIINKNVYFDYIYIQDLLKIIDWFIHNQSKEKIYNATTGKKIDLISLANLVNKTSDFKSEIKVLNNGLNNEYTSNNDRLLKELGSFIFTTHKDAISKIREYFKYNISKIDRDIIINDPYLKKIDNIWKKED